MGTPGKLLMEAENDQWRCEETDKKTYRGFATLPYVKSLSEAVRRILEEDGIKVIFKPFNKLGDILTHIKDPVPLEERKGLFCQIPCLNCPEVYIGETQRRFSTRCKEHHAAYGLALSIMRRH